MCPFSPGAHQIVDSSLAQSQVPYPPDEPKIPKVIEENKPLLGIVKKCLLPQPSQRPTAAALCKMLLRLCRSSVIRSAVLDIGKS